MIMKGQSDNTAWFQLRKGTITASKSYEIETNMGRFVEGESGYVNMWSSCQKISGLISINPNIPGLNMEGIWSNMLLMHFLKFLNATAEI